MSNIVVGLNAIAFGVRCPSWRDNSRLPFASHHPLMIAIEQWWLTDGIRGVPPMYAQAPLENFRARPKVSTATATSYGPVGRHSPDSLGEFGANIPASVGRNHNLPSALPPVH